MTHRTFFPIRGLWLGARLETDFTLLSGAIPAHFFMELRGLSILLTGLGDYPRVQFMNKSNLLQIQIKSVQQKLYLLDLRTFGTEIFKSNRINVNQLDSN